MAKNLLRVKIWLSCPAGDIGAGHLQIMHEIARSGSILAASRKLGLSYKKTWSKKANTERLLGGDIFISQPGRSAKSGTTLSPRAQAIAQAFEQLESDIRAYAQSRYDELLAPLLRESSADQHRKNFHDRTK